MPFNKQGQNKQIWRKSELFSPAFYHTQKINSKSSRLKNIKIKTAMILEENKRNNLSDLGVSKDFLQRTKKLYTNHTKKNIVNESALKCKSYTDTISTDTIKNMKRQAPGMEKIFVIYISHKSLIIHNI